MRERQKVQAGRAPGLNCECCYDLFQNRKGWKRHVNGYVFDHDHATGKFRGWICPSCNLALGLAFDSPRRLTQMITYLRRFQERQVV